MMNKEKVIIACCILLAGISTTAGFPAKEDMKTMEIKFPEYTGGIKNETLFGFCNVLQWKEYLIKKNGAYMVVLKPNSGGCIEFTLKKWQPQNTVLTVELSDNYPRYDTTADNSVNILDLNAVGQHYGENVSRPPEINGVSYPNPFYDVDNNGFVNMTDIDLVAENFGAGRSINVYYTEGGCTVNASDPYNQTVKCPFKGGLL